MDLKNKNVTVVGLGKSGLAALQLLKQQGAKARATEVSAKDSVACLAEKLRSKGIEVQTGGHTEGFLEGAELIVTSPGVPDTSLPLEWARRKKIKVIDEIELAYRFCKAPVIAVTGTNGKSTTVSLIGHIFKNSARKALVCGNIGEPFSGHVKNLCPGSVVVLEVSSFQLSRIEGFRPHVAVFLNATDNHLDRHSDFAEYFNAKMRIFENQKTSDWAVLNYEDKNIVKAARKIKAKKIFFSPSESGALFVEIGRKRFDICSSDELKIKGRHNIENALAASAAACAFGVPPKTIAAALATFAGLEHRCEYVTTINGINFINDSKSTTVDAAIKALNSCDGKIILIAGGRDKNSDFTLINKYVREKVKTLILIGEAKDKIKNALAGSTDIKEAPSLEAATESAFNIAAKGESVLLSPMCASFDSFKDFEHRGRVFKDAVMRLKQRCASQG